MNIPEKQSILKVTGQEINQNRGFILTMNNQEKYNLPKEALIVVIGGGALGVFLLVLAEILVALIKR